MYSVIYASLIQISLIILAMSVRAKEKSQVMNRIQFSCLFSILEFG